MKSVIPFVKTISVLQ